MILPPLDLSTCIVLGGSDGAAEMYRAVRSRHPDATVATTNAGILIEPDPAIYWLTDKVAPSLYGEQALSAAARGTTIVSNELAYTRNQRLRSFPGVCITMRQMREIGWWPPRNHRYETCRISGTMLTELLVLEGAETIHLVGMNGKHEPRDRSGDNHEQLKSPPRHFAFQLLFERSPQCRFIFHGRPNYPWRGKNVEVRP